MLDPEEQLRSFYKSGLREHGFIKGSRMPSYREKLSRQELADVLAYLSTLKGVAAE
jgi:mono/diheme cytochrome c family protein